MIVYTQYEGSQLLVLIEMPCAQGLTFETDFKFYIDNWADHVHNVNPLIKEVHVLEPVDGNRVVRQVANVPTPLSNRITYCALYTNFNFRPNEHLFVLSTRGAEPRI